MTELITLVGAGAISLAGVLFGNNGPSVKVQCVESYGQCLTAGQPKAQCDILLETVCKKKLKKEDEVRNRGEI